MNKSFTDDYSFHPFDTKNCKIRLRNEYEKHKKLVVGFDFDNTIFDCHNNGGNYSQVIELLKRCKILGFILCLYTAEADNEKLKWKMEYCKHFGITPDYVNNSPLLGGITDKPFFNILLDDRAGLKSAFYTLLDVVNYVESIRSDQSKQQ